MKILNFLLKIFYQNLNVFLIFYNKKDIIYLYFYEELFLSIIF
jgi:hypothetical protein